MLTLGFELNKGTDDDKHHDPHCWDSKDVTEFDVTLSGSGKVLSQVAVQVAEGQSAAVFNHLKFGVPYELQVVAIGNHAGNPHAPVEILDKQTPATASVLFSGVNDVSNDQTVNVGVVLDCGHLAPQG